MYMFINSDENEIHLKTKKSNPVYWETKSLVYEYKDILLSSLVNIDQPTKQNFINFKYIHYL